MKISFTFFWRAFFLPFLKDMKKKRTNKIFLPKLPQNKKHAFSGMIFFQLFSFHNLKQWMPKLPTHNCTNFVITNLRTS